MGAADQPQVNKWTAWIMPVGAYPLAVEDETGEMTYATGSGVGTVKPAFAIVDCHREPPRTCGPPTDDVT